MQINTEPYIVHLLDVFALSVDMFNLLWNYVLTDSVCLEGRKKLHSFENK